MLTVYSCVIAACLLIQSAEANWERVAEEVQMKEFGAIGTPTVRIGTAITLDSRSTHAVMGRYMARSYELFFKWLNNERGGINIGGVWHKAELVLAGDQSSPAQARDVTRYLIEKLNITLLLGPYGSQLTAPAAKQAQSLGAVMVAPASSATTVFAGRPSVFGMLTPAAKILIPAFAAVGTRVRSVSSFREDATYTNEVCSAVPSLASEYGMEVIGPEGGLVISQIPSEEEVKDIVADLKAANPEFLIGCVREKACKAILQEMRRQDFAPLQVMSTICVTSPGFAEELGDTSRWIGGLAPWTPKMSLPSDFMQFNATYFADYFEKMYGEVPPYQSAASWASCETLVTAIERAGTTDPGAVAAQLAQIDMKTIFGRVKFDMNGQNTNLIKVVQFKEGDDLPRVVYPPLVANNEVMTFPMPAWRNRKCFQAHPRNSFYGHHGDENHICGVCPDGLVGTFYASLQKRICRGCGARMTATNVEADLRVCTYGCPAGEIDDSDGDGTHRCRKCEAGRYQEKHMCQACPRGKYSLQNQTWCDACKEGRFAKTKGNSACTNCSLGKAMGEPEAKKCNKCPKGKFANVNGSRQCEMCAAGTVAQAPGSSACRTCEAGKYSSYDASRCEACKPGKYQNVPGQSFCEAVRKGAYAPRKGTVNPNNKEKYWQKNIWRNGTHNAEGWELCNRRPDACLVDESCKEGHAGRQCSTCLPGYFMNAVRKCYKCWSRTWYITISSLVTISMTLSIMIMALLIKKGANRPQDVHSIIYKQLFNHIITASVCSEMLQEAYSEIQSKTRGDVDIGLFMTHGFHWGYGLPRSEFSILSVSCLTERSLGETKDALIRTLFGAKHYDYSNPALQPAWEALREQASQSEMTFVLFWMVYPIFMICFATGLGYLALVWRLRRSREAYMNALDFYLSVYAMGFKSARKKVLHERCQKYVKLYYKKVFDLWSPVQHIRSFRKRGLIDHKRFWLECAPVRSAVAFQTYGSIVYGCIRAVKCVPLTGNTDEDFKVVLASRSEVKCTFDHLLPFVALMGFLFWSVGFPIYLFGSLRRVRSKMRKMQLTPELLVDFALLRNGYKPECWAWEVLMYVRKSCVIAMVAVPFRMWHPEARALVFLLTAIVFAVLTLAFKPYDNRSNGLLNKMERYQLIYWLVASCGLTIIQNSPWSITYVLLPFFLLAAHWSYILLAIYHIFHSICISLVSTEPNWRPHYIKHMKPGIRKTFKEFILNRALADWGHKKPYIALDPYYGWVTLVGSVANEVDTKAPYIVKGAEARRDSRFDGNRPPLSMVARLLQEDHTETTLHRHSTASSGDFTKQASLVIAPKAKKGGVTFKSPNQRCRQQLHVILMEVMNFLVTGHIDAQSSKIDPETGEPELTPQTYSVSILEFIIRAAFLLHKDASELDINQDDTEVEDIEQGYWQEANRQRNPLALLEEEEDVKRTRERRDRVNQAQKRALDLDENEDANEEAMADLDDLVLQERGMQMQDELRDFNHHVIMTKGRAKQIREEQVERAAKYEEMERALARGEKISGSDATQIAGICWGVPTRMSLIQLESEKIVGHGENDNGPFNLIGRGHVDGVFTLTVTNKLGNFSVELSLSASSQGQYLGKTLDGGYDGVPCKFNIQQEEVVDKKADSREEVIRDEQNLDEIDEGLRRTKRREKLVKWVDHMFSPNLFNRKGLKLEDLQTLALELQRKPKEDLLDWLDLFEDRWAVESCKANFKLMHMAGVFSDEHEVSDQHQSQVTGALVSKGTQFPEDKAAVDDKKMTLDDVLDQIGAPHQSAEGYSDGMSPVPRSAMVLMSEVSAFVWSWQDQKSIPLKRKLNQLRQSLGASQQHWEECVEVRTASGHLINLHSPLIEEQFPLYVKFVDRSRPSEYVSPEEMKNALRWIKLALLASGGMSTFKISMVKPAILRASEVAAASNLEMVLSDIKRQQVIEAQNLEATEGELAELRGALDAQRHVATPRTPRSARSQLDAVARSQEEQSAQLRRLGSPHLPDKPEAAPAGIYDAAPAGTELPIGDAEEELKEFPMEMRRAKPKRSCRMCGVGGGLLG